MARKLANSVLQASTIDILNVIRANASAERLEMSLWDIRLWRISF